MFVVNVKNMIKDNVLMLVVQIMFAIKNLKIKSVECIKNDIQSKIESPLF